MFNDTKVVKYFVLTKLLVKYFVLIKNFFLFPDVRKKKQRASRQTAP
nr:MAG TPA: hypothetical protein [Caudoviricetes sp.]